MNALCVNSFLEVNFLKLKESIISFKWNKLEKKKSRNKQFIQTNNEGRPINYIDNLSNIFTLPKMLWDFV